MMDAHAMTIFGEHEIFEKSYQVNSRYHNDYPKYGYQVGYSAQTFAEGTHASEE